jgi:hypothetical protein
MLVAVFAATLVVPAAAAAQYPSSQDDVVLISGLRVSPFAGYLTRFTREEEWYFQEGAASSFVQADVSVAGGTAFGLQLEGPIGGRFGFAAAAAYGSRGDTDFSIRQTGDAFLIDGNHVFMGRLGVALHLHEDVSELMLRQLNASLFAGGVVMHERPRTRLVTDDALANGTHFGLNLGVNAEAPFANNRFAIQLGVEDNMMWWSKAPLRALASEYFGRPGASDDNTSVTAALSHVWLLRAGLQFRF